VQVVKIQQVYNLFPNSIGVTKRNFQVTRFRSDFQAALQQAVNCLPDKQHTIFKKKKQRKLKKSHVTTTLLKT
jgi:hypothetical protein